MSFVFCTRDFNCAVMSPYVLMEHPVSMSQDDILRYKLNGLAPGSRLEAWPSKLQLAFVAANALADLHERGLDHGCFSTYSLYVKANSNADVLGAPCSGSIQVLWPGFVPAHESLTPWAAPEVRNGHVSASQESDVYALGVLLAELDTLAMPSTGLGQLRDDCEHWYASIVAGCMAEDPTARMSAAAVVAALQPHMDAATRQNQVADG
ncbi:hypothetical protein SPRG_13103 [Saprolegnia parasitica CBS 223.65]|uniref:Protein kinase domain-containing protein n=1 Tax=Saprolegnia parasitica (strain CBS 223.65) TaxID=695850 RepID=A0A067C5U2_SAPPC|nr:hypothetical protein SPRG_13103 [Saprolegnia parasitica CBS 223.65]KDO21921.1 hypothetical protein SPRG_13103 [Saprolegnia parasitica CBS 223.65]|eukprot:XP_012207363.1 hypothetical protein SPRG_13103 [Saprolegnia parasitica CBS 223.65]